MSAFDAYEDAYFRKLRKMEEKFMYQNVPTKVLTGEVRLSYVHLSQPYANPNQPNSEPKYSATLLIPKADVATYQDILSSRDAAYEAAVQNEWKGARPQLRSMLIYDGDGVRQDGSPFGPECAGHWVITANTKRKPQVVEISNVNVELAPQDIYSGMYARVTLNFFSFNSNGNKGVGCGLGNVLKTRDGEPLAGGATAAQDFEGIEQAMPIPAPGPVAGGVYAPGVAPGMVPTAAPVAGAMYASPAATSAVGGAYAPGVAPATASMAQATQQQYGVAQSAVPTTNPIYAELPFN